MEDRAKIVGMDPDLDPEDARLIAGLSNLRAKEIREEGQD